MKSIGYKDKEGNELTVLEWGALFEDMSYRLIATEMIGDIQVSTIWLGLEDWNGNYFETGIFNKARELIEMIRYDSFEMAKLGHEAEVWRVKNGLDKCEG